MGQLCDSSSLDKVGPLYQNLPQKEATETVTLRLKILMEIPFRVMIGRYECAF